MTGRRKILIGGGSAVGIIVIVVVVLVVILLLRLSQPGEATAKFVPSDASINLRPGGSQINHARKIAEILDGTEFRDQGDDWLEELEDETGIDLEEDLSWVGTDVTFVALDAGPDVVEWVLFAQTGDPDSARDFIEDIVSYFENSESVEFDRKDRGDVELWVAEDTPVAIGIAGEYVFVADSEDTVRDMADNIASSPSRSLAEDPNFMSAREALPDQRIMFMFAQTEELVEAFGGLADPLGGFDVFEQFGEATPEFMAASASFVEKGFRFDMAFGASSDDFVVDTENLLKSPDSLPEDTVVLVSTVGLDAQWDGFRDSLDELGLFYEEDMNDFLEEIEDESGVDLDEVFDALSGEIAFALLRSDVETGLFSNGDLDESAFAGSAIELLLMAGPGDLATIEEAIKEAVEALEDAGAEFDTELLGEYTATLAVLDELTDTPTGYTPGYVVTEDWAVIGSTIDSLEVFYDAASGDIDRLSSAARFSRILDLAPVPLQFLMYVDFQGVLDMVEDGMDEGDRADYEEDVQPFLEPFEAFLMAASATEDIALFTVAVTLQE